MLKKMFLTTTALVMLGVSSAAADGKVLKYTHYQPGREDQPKHAAALAFETCVEKATSNSIDVQIFPAGQLGNAAPHLPPVLRRARHEKRADQIVRQRRQVARRLRNCHI